MSREGASQLTTNRIARVAGVSIGTLYQYFADKEALVAEVRRRYDDAFRERLLGLMQRAGSMRIGEAIEHFVRALIEIHAENPGLHNAVSAGLVDSERRLLQQVAASWLEARHEEVRRPNRALAAALAMDTAEALIHGIALREPERLADEDLVGEVTDLLVRYLVK